MSLDILFPNGQVLAVQVYIKDPISGNPVEWDGAITIGTIIATITNDGTFATPARQDTGNTSLASIDTKLTNPLPISGAVSFTTPQHIIVDSGSTSGGLTDTQLRASAVPISLATAPTTPITNANLDSSLSGILTELQQKTEPANQQHAIIDSGNIIVTGAVSISNFPATQPVSGTVAVSNMIPAVETGLATSSKQDTGNASLATIAGKDFATAANQTTGNNSLSSIDTKLTNPLPVNGSISVSNMIPAVETGLATAARQDTGNTTLAEIAVDTDNLDIPLSDLASETGNLLNLLTSAVDNQTTQLLLLREMRLLRQAFQDWARIGEPRFDNDLLTLN